MRRGPAEFRNVLLAERADDDFAHLVARLCVFSVWRLALLDRLTASRDPMLAAIAGKGVKEVTYHRDYAAQWVVRLGDGTALSHQRMSDGVLAVTPLIGPLFQAHPIEERLAAAGVAVDPASLRDDFQQVWEFVLTTSGLSGPPVPPSGSPPASLSPPAPPASLSPPAGRSGEHTPALAAILDEMQETARTVPGGVW